MGKAIVSGAGRATFPTFGILANTLEIGTTVKLMEDGVATEFLVVHQGLPSDLYDTSCDGTWLLRKDIHSKRQWNSTQVNQYSSSSVNTWLNGDYFNLLGTVEQTVIKRVRIPYAPSGGSKVINSGENGLNTKVFLLAGYETGMNDASIWTNMSADGSKLAYFEAGLSTSASNKRIAYLSGAAAKWWLRSVTTNGTVQAYYVSTGGGDSTQGVSDHSDGIRPALIIPSTSRFDQNTLLLKG